MTMFRGVLLAAGALGLAVAQPKPETPSAGTPTFGTTVVISSGLRGDIYLLPDGTTMLPEFKRGSRKPEGSVWTTRLDVSPRRWRAGFPGVTKRFEWFAINYTGRFWIEKPGRYRFALLSDDGSKLYIDDQLVIDNDCQHAPDVRAADVALGGGIHRLRVPYFQGPRDCVALILAVAGPGEPWRVFSTDDFKPPANPENWSYGEPGDLVLPTDPLSFRVRLTQLLEALDEQDASDTSTGCVAYPTRNCGN